MIGAVGSIVAGVLAASSATANLARVEAPGSVTTQLQAGRYSLWAPSDRNLTFYDVIIEGPAGTVEYRPYGFFGSSDAIVDGGATYRSDGFFEPPVAGSYTVTLTDDGQDLSEPMTVSRLWDALRERRSSTSATAPVEYTWFILALDFLFMVGAIEARQGVIVRSAP